MGPRHLLLIAALLLGRAEPPRASLFCGRLEYWNPDNRCCGSCLQRFGPPSCPDHEFTENCGLSDYGDHLAHPFQECAPGRCNPDGAELCRPCGVEAAAPVPARSSGGRRRSCRKRRVPSRKPCRLPTPSVLGAQEPSPPAVSSASWSPERGHTPAGDVSLRALQSFALPVVVVSLATFFLILLLAVGRRCCRRQNATPLPYAGLVCSGLDTLFPLHTSSPGSLKAPELGNAQRVGSLLPVQALGPPTLATQPLSRLLDELEVLEELIVLLDPEPGPGGSVACGTTRHLAAQYGLPAAWSTFAYSLRPSRSPLRALLEVVVAREPTACLGQLATHLARLGRADALQVLSKLS
ncbi:IGF-like family receptor 1 [Loxodonta africana]|uniref:IGF-like family receptor 1 n=1 Tax=Loxodonta africana TaxID=9785 RepID=UPI0030CC9F78